MSLILLLTILIYVYFFSRGKRYSGRLPPGSLGLPLIGQSFELLEALKTDKVDEWCRKKIAKHGLIWKASLFGYPTVVLHGVKANKFVFTCDENILTNTQPPSINRMLGINNILELTGDDHKRVRGAFVSFLKIDFLKQYVAKVDEEIQAHLMMHWHGKDEVQVQSLMKTLTFNMICSLLFGIERAKREEFLPLFQDIIKSFLAFPVNLPFFQFSRGLKSRKKLVTLLVDLIQEKRDALNKQKELQVLNPHADLITSLLSFRDEDNSITMSDDEIIDNIIIAMVAGHDTTSVLLTFLVRILANNDSIYSNILQEQEEISKCKASGEALTWEDLTKMNYTWRVASEMLRLNPPVSLTFRRVAKDFEYEGYIIPKGWQVMLFPPVTYMDDSIFQNPTLFDPARFEKDSPPPPPFSLFPFGAGRRMCPGMEFAKIETLAMIHYLVTLFKWDLVNKDESFKRIPMPEFDHGLPIRIRPIK
uniref:taxadiene 5-alpha hydroxylase-like n=1 Tax=Erigeron canadensis TaxID=72917 RepID=UPI001CB9CB15|nr:taxadiene 5-alpha hydroxylase-like [Erigeron canadensis]